MKAWTAWETTRRQVAIGGRVVDARDRAVAGAEVTLTATRDDRPRGTVDPSHTTVDGLYHFLDLPAGTYTVRGVDRRSGAEATKTVTVSWGADGRVRMAVADLELSKAARGG